MDDRFNTIAGWALAGGIAALGLSIVSGMVFHSERPEKMGYAIEGVEEAGEGGVAELDGLGERARSVGVGHVGLRAATQREGSGMHSWKRPFDEVTLGFGSGSPILPGRVGGVERLFSCPRTATEPAKRSPQRWATAAASSKMKCGRLVATGPHP